MNIERSNTPTEDFIQATGSGDNLNTQIRRSLRVPREPRLESVRIESGLSELRKPDRTASAGGIFDHVCYYLEAVCFKQISIFIGIQTRVVKRLASVSAHCDAVRCAARDRKSTRLNSSHQHRSRMPSSA